MVSTYEVPGDTHVPNNFPPGQSNLTVNLRKPRHMVFSCLVRSHLGFIEAAPTSRKTCQTGQLLVFCLSQPPFTQFSLGSVLGEKGVRAGRKLALPSKPVVLSISKAGLSSLQPRRHQHSPQKTQRPNPI